MFWPTSSWQSCILTYTKLTELYSDQHQAYRAELYSDLLQAYRAIFWPTPSLQGCTLTYTKLTELYSDLLLAYRAIFWSNLNLQSCILTCFKLTELYSDVLQAYRAMFWSNSSLQRCVLTYFTFTEHIFWPTSSFKERTIYSSGFSAKRTLISVSASSLQRGWGRRARAGFWQQRLQTQRTNDQTPCYFCFAAHTRTKGGLSNWSVYKAAISHSFTIPPVWSIWNTWDISHIGTIGIIRNSSKSNWAWTIL